MVKLKRPDPGELIEIVNARLVTHHRAETAVLDCPECCYNRPCKDRAILEAAKREILRNMAAQEEVEGTLIRWPSDQKT